MPDPNIVLWSTAVGLIVLMLGIIGYLVREGFTTLKETIMKELKVIWEKIDKHQLQAEQNAANIQESKAIALERKENCEARHRAVDAELARLRDQIEE